MQFNIKINQLAFHSLYPDLDIKDAAIFDFLYKVFAVFESKGERISFEGRSFYWVSYSKAIEEMPMLKISNERAMKRHFDNLVDAGLLERHPNCVKLKKSYFAFTSKIERLVFSKPQDFDYVPKSTEYPKVLCTEKYTVKGVDYVPKSTEYPKVLCTEKYTVKGVDYVPKSTQDNNTNIHSTIERGKIPPNPPLYQNLNTDIQVVTPTLKEEKEIAPPSPPRPKLTPEQKAAELEAKKEEAKKAFYQKLVPFVGEYGKEMVRAFFDYWTEASDTGKMRFQDQKFFEHKKRLATWKSKENKYSEKNKISATTGAKIGTSLATKENTSPHTHRHFDLLQRVLAQYPNTLNYARWFSVEEMERWGAERPEFLPVLHQMWTGRFMELQLGRALSELEGSPWRRQNSEGGLFSYLVGWLNENYH